MDVIIENNYRDKPVQAIPKNKVNIFESQEKEKNEDFQLNYKGPQYDKSGNLKQYSIVGSNKEFMKCKEKFDINQFADKTSPMQRSGLVSNPKLNRMNSVNTSNTSILSGSGVMQLQSTKKGNKNKKQT